MKKYLAPILFFGLTMPSVAFAGQGMFLQLNGFVPNTAITIDSSQCVSLPDQILPNKEYYLEAKSSYLCFFKDSEFSLSIWKQAKKNEKLASYDFKVSTYGSSVFPTYLNPSYANHLQLFPHVIGRDGQDLVLGSVAQLNLADWMASLSPATKLYNLSLAGAHDSGTSTISSKSTLTIDAEDPIPKLYKYGTSIARSIIAGWSKTQTKTISQQLNSGIRYFDLRLCGNANISSITTCHAVAGQSLTDLVAQVKQFSLAHPHEVILLDFNHWYPTDDDESKMRVSVAKYLTSELSNIYASRQQFNMESSLNDLWTAQRRILLFSEKTKLMPGFWKTNPMIGSASLKYCKGGDMCSMWTATSDKKKHLQELTAAFKFLQNQAERNYLFSVQMQLTPSDETIKDGLNITSNSPTSLATFTADYKDEFLNYFMKADMCKNLSGLIFDDDFVNGVDLVSFAKQCTK